MQITGAPVRMRTTNKLANLRRRHQLNPHRSSRADPRPPFRSRPWWSAIGNGPRDQALRRPKSNSFIKPPAIVIRRSDAVHHPARRTSSPWPHRLHAHLSGRSECHRASSSEEEVLLAVPPGRNLLNVVQVWPRAVAGRTWHTAQVREKAFAQAAEKTFVLEN